jgi:hypothetical protein
VKKPNNPLAPTEHKLQVALVDYLAYAAKPEIFYFAIPNQGNRHIMNATKMKAEGVRSGVADLCFMLPAGRVAWLEMKTAKGALSETQKAFRDRALALGHHWALARSVDEAIEHLTAWGVMKPAYMRGKSFFKTDHLEQVQLNPLKQAS